MKKKKQETIFTQGGESVHGLVQAEFALRNRLGSAEAVILDPANQLASKIDIVLKDGTPMEVKSTSLQELRQMVSPKLEHVAQLGYYIRSTQQSHGFLMYVAREAPGVRRVFRVDSRGKYRAELDNSDVFMTLRREGTNADKFRSATDSVLKTYRSNEYYAQQYKRFSDDANLLASRLKEMQRKKDWKQTYRQAQNALYEKANLNVSGIQNNFGMTSEWGTPTKRKDFHEQVRSLIEQQTEAAEGVSKASASPSQKIPRKSVSPALLRKKSKLEKTKTQVTEQKTKKLDADFRKKQTGALLRTEREAFLEERREISREYSERKSLFKKESEELISSKNELLRRVRRGQIHLDDAVPELLKLEQKSHEVFTNYRVPGETKSDLHVLVDSRKHIYSSQTSNITSDESRRLFLAKQTDLPTELPKADFDSLKSSSQAVESLTKEEKSLRLASSRRKTSVEQLTDLKTKEQSLVQEVDDWEKKLTKAGDAEKAHPQRELNRRRNALLKTKEKIGRLEQEHAKPLPTPDELKEAREKLKEAKQKHAQLQSEIFGRHEQQVEERIWDLKKQAHLQGGVSPEKLELLELERKKLNSAIPQDTKLPSKKDKSLLARLLRNRHNTVYQRSFRDNPFFALDETDNTFHLQGKKRRLADLAEQRVDKSGKSVYTYSHSRGGDFVEKQLYERDLRRAYRRAGQDPDKMAKLLHQSSEHSFFYRGQRRREVDQRITRPSEVRQQLKTGTLTQEQAKDKLKADREKIKEITEGFVQREKIIETHSRAKTLESDLMKADIQGWSSRGKDIYGDAFHRDGSNLQEEELRIQKEVERRRKWYESPEYKERETRRESRRLAREKYREERASRRREREAKRWKDGYKVRRPSALQAAIGRDSLPLPKDPRTPVSPQGKKSIPSFGQSPLTFFDIETSFAREGRRGVIFEFSGAHFSKESVAEIRDLQKLEEFYRQGKKNASDKVLELKASVLSSESHQKIHAATSVHELKKEGVLTEDAIKHYQNRAKTLRDSGTSKVTMLDLIKQDAEEMFHATYQKLEDGSIVPKAKYSDLKRVDTLDDFLRGQRSMFEQIGQFFDETRTPDRKLAGHNIEQFDIPMLQAMEDSFKEGEVTKAQRTTSLLDEVNQTKKEIKGLRALNQEKTLDTLRGDRSKLFFETLKKHTSVFEGETFASLFDKVETPDGRRKTLVALENLSQAMGLVDASKVEAGKGAHRASYDVLQQNVPVFAYQETFLNATEEEQKRMAAEMTTRYQAMVDGKKDLGITSPVPEFQQENITKKTLGDQTSSLDDALPKTKAGKFLREARDEGRTFFKKLSEVNTVFEDSIDYVLGKRPGKAHSTFLRRPALVFGGLGIAAGMLGVVSVASNFTSTPKRPIRPTTRPLVQEDAQLLNQEESPQKIIQRASTDFGSGWQGLRKALPIPALRKPSNLTLPEFSKSVVSTEARTLESQAVKSVENTTPSVKPTTQTPPKVQDNTPARKDVSIDNTLSEKKREFDQKVKRQIKFRQMANQGTRPYFEALKNQTGHHRMVN